MAEKGQRKEILPEMEEQELLRRPFVIDTPEGSITALLPVNYAAKMETDPLTEEEFKDKISKFIKSNPGVLNVLINDDGTIEEIHNAEQPDHPEQDLSDEDDNSAPFKWTPEITKLLIDEVQSHQRDHPRQPKKKMFQEITANLNKENNLSLTELQVTNKYKTLIRGYKNVVDNNKKTGTSRKHHLFEKELEELTKGNPNIKPSYTLSSSASSSSAGVAVSSSSDDSFSKEDDASKCSKESRKRPRSEITEFLREESERQDQRFKLFMDQMEKMQEKKLELFREIFGPKKD